MLNRNIPLLASCFHKVLVLDIPKEDIYYYNAVGTHQIIVPEEMIDDDMLFSSITRIVCDANKYKDEYSFERPFMTVLPMPREDIKQGRFMPILEFFANASIDPFESKNICENDFNINFHKQKTVNSAVAQA